MPAPGDVRPLTLWTMLDVAARLRPECLADIKCFIGDISPEVYAMNRIQTAGEAWSFHGRDGIPYCAAGLQFEGTGVATWWLATTAAVEKHALTIARFGRNAVMSLLATGDCHRIQAFVRADWNQARKLAETIGLSYEGTMRRLGVQGEDVTVYARIDGLTLQT
jgi:hypothetical protein